MKSVEQILMECSTLFTVPKTMQKLYNTNQKLNVCIFTNLYVYSPAKRRKDSSFF